MDEINFRSISREYFIMFKLTLVVGTILVLRKMIAFMFVMRRSLIVKKKFEIKTRNLKFFDV